MFEGAVYGVWKDLDHPIFQVIDQESRNWGAFGRLAWAGDGGMAAARRQYRTCQIRCGRRV